MKTTEDPTKRSRKSPRRPHRSSRQEEVGSKRPAGPATCLTGIRTPNQQSDRVSENQELDPRRNGLALPRFVPSSRNECSEGHPDDSSPEQVDAVGASRPRAVLFDSPGPTEAQQEGRRE